MISLHCAALYCIVYFPIIFSIFMMARLNYCKPKSELDRFKSECEVLFNGPLDESPPNRQAGLVVNGLGSEAGLTLQSLNLMYV